MKIISIVFLFTCFWFFAIPPVLATFSFSIPQTSIAEDQEIEATVNLSLQNQGNKIYYLEGAFKREGGTNYFGQTWNDTDWVGYSSTNADKSLKSITTTSEGSWSGVLKIKLDTTSSQLTGSGNYILKINRFTSSGSSPTASDNEATLAVIVNSTPTPTATPTPTNTPTPTPTSTPTPTKSPTPTKTPTKTPTSTSQPSPSSTSNPKIPSSILGTSISATPEPSSKEEGSSPLKNIAMFGGGSVLILSGILFATFIVKRRSKQI